MEHRIYVSLRRSQKLSRRKKSSGNISFYIRIVVKINISIGTVSFASLKGTEKHRIKHLENFKYHISTNVILEKRQYQWSLLKFKLNKLSKRKRKLQVEESNWKKTYAILMGNTSARSP